MKAREARQPVAFPVSIRQDAGWSGALIRNLSSRGMMLDMKNPPIKGAFVEIRRGKIVIVGQVRWTDGDRCGLRTQDRISIAQLKTAHMAAAQEKFDTAAVVEHRAIVRVLTPEEIAARSRMKSAFFQRTTFITGAIFTALFLASLLFDVLSRPMAAIARKLG